MIERYSVFETAGQRKMDIRAFVIFCEFWREEEGVVTPALKDFQVGEKVSSHVPSQGLVRDPARPDERGV